MTELFHFDNKAFRIHAGRPLFLGAPACAAHAYADHYKWMDTQGKVHFSDQLPTVKAQVIQNGAAGQAESAAKARQTLNARDEAYQKRLKEAEEARAKAEKDAEQARA